MEKNSSASIMTNQIILRVAVCDIMINGSGLCIAAAKSDSGLQCNEESADRDDQHIHGQALQRLPFSWALRRSKTKNSVMSRMYSRIRTPLSKSDLSNFRRALAYAMKSLWTMPGHSLSHGSQYFACLASFQRWMVLSTFSTIFLHKKMRKPVRSHNHDNSCTKFRTGEGMVVAHAVGKLGARFTA